MSIIYKSTRLMVQHYLASRYLRVVRNEVPFDTIAEVKAVFRACSNAFDDIDKSQYGILLDWRCSPISTDPAMHKALVEHADLLVMPFARKAVLFSTPVGTMQGGRLKRNVGNPNGVVIFGDEAAALEFVTDS